MDILFLVGRIIFGGYFVMMGMNHFMKMGMMTQYAQSKGIPSANMAVAVSGLFILFGGIGVLLGAFIPYAVALLVVFLVVVSFKMHNFWAVPDPQMKMTDMTNFMKNMALAAAALMMLSIPTPWVFSIL